MSDLILPDSGLLVGGYFDVEHVRNGEVIDHWTSKNIVVNEGLNFILDHTFDETTADLAPWYVGIFESNSTPAATWTAGQIGTEQTECTTYDEATRVAYVEGTATSQQITNSASKATFTINATKTIYGAFLVSDSTKSATSGTMFAASKFSAARSVVATDQLLITYTISASDA